MFRKLIASARSLFAPSLVTKTGAHPDRHDPRDFIRATAATPPPARVDLSAFGRTEAWNQGSLSACTGYATAAAVTNLFGRLSPQTRWDPSPLFLYYHARQFDGLSAFDGGASLRSMMKVLHQIGIPEFSQHPTQTDWRLAPSAEAARAAELMRIKDYQRILVGPEAPLEMMKTLHQEQLPLVITVLLHQNVNSSEVRYYGDIPMPAAEAAILGAHAMMLDGFDAEQEKFFGWNSWGRTWGKGGRFSLPFQYFTRPDLCYDIWSFSPAYW